jgi:flagellar FliL protein
MASAEGSETAAQHQTGHLSSIVIVTAIAVVLGCAAGVMTSIVARPAAELPQTAQVGTTRYDKTTTVTLPAIVSMLASEGDRQPWVRLEGALILDGTLSQTSAQALAAKVADDSLAYLRTLPIAAVAGVSGLNALRDDLRRRARQRAGGNVREFLISGLVVE